MAVGSRADYWRRELLYRASDIERHPGPTQARPLRGQDVLVQDVLPTTAQRYDVAVSENIACQRHPSDRMNHLNELGHLCIQYLRTCFASGTLGPGQAGTLNSGLRRYALLARSCGAALEDQQSAFRSWRVHRSWSLAIPAEFRTPVSHEIVFSVAVSAWFQNVPELSLLTLLSFHCLLRPAEARAT